MCNGKDNEYGSDVTESFEKYAQTLIRYLEVKASSDRAQQEYEDTNDTSDEDVMFPSSTNNVRAKSKYKMNPFTLDHFIRK
jgi:hypothetical protein